MLTEDLKQYSNTLTSLHINHEIKNHPVLKTPPEVCAYLGITLANGLSTMIMKANDKYIAIIRRDDCRIDFKKIKNYVGKNVRMATPEEFTNLTGMPLGAARVYNPGLATYLDDKIFEKEYLIGGSGSFICSIEYKTADLKNIPNSSVVSISQE